MKSIACLLIFGEVIVKNLNGHYTLEGCIEAFVNDAHSTASKLLVDLIAI